MSLGHVRAGPTPLTTFGPYSYGDVACWGAVDPIGTVFTFGNGNFDHVYQHAARPDHGEWEERAGGQNFLDDFGCSTSDDSAASNDGIFRDRYHMRYEVAATTNFGQSYAATPHFDDFDFQASTHCIRPPTATYPGGFADGRNNVYTNWVDEHPMVIRTNYWGNTERIRKCSNQFAYGDGYVDYIDIRPDH